MDNPWAKKAPRHPGMDAFNLDALIYVRGQEKEFTCPLCESTYRAPHWRGVGVYDHCLPSSGRVWSHGLNAYLGGKRAYDILRKGTIVAIGTTGKLGPMISCTDRGSEVGTVGIYVTGGELVKYAGDVWSDTDHLGRRYGEEGCWDREIGIHERSSASYDEVLVRPYAVTGVWVRVEASDWDVQAAEELAKMLDVPLHDEWFDGPLNVDFPRNYYGSKEEYLRTRSREIRDYKMSRSSEVREEARYDELYKIQDALEAS